MRRRRRQRETGSDPRQQALQLIELALDENTTLEERRTAAVRAVKHIDKYDLLARPFESNKKVQKLIEVADQLSETAPSLMSGLKDVIDLGGDLLKQRRERRR